MTDSRKDRVEMTVPRINKAKRMLEKGTSAKDVAKALGISVATLYNWFPGGSRRYSKKPRIVR